VARPKTKPRVLQPQPTLRLKILVVGETRCGKTSLVHAYLHNNAMGTDPDGETNWTPLFGPTSLQFEKTNYVPTIGVDYYAAAVPTSRVIPASASTPGCIARVHTSFIDLSGDLAYVKVRSEFYSDWNVILFCFDCTKRETFTQLESWVAEADKFNPNANQQKGQLKVVVACKCDYAHSGPGFTREVPTAEAKAWAEAKGMHYVETSAWLAMSDEVPLSKRQNTAKILDGVFANASGELKLPAGFTQADQPSSASSASSGAHNASESKFASQQSGYSSSSTSNNTSSTSSGSGGLPHPSSMSVHALMAELTERGVPRVRMIQWSCVLLCYVHQHPALCVSIPFSHSTISHSLYSLNGVWRNLKWSKLYLKHGSRHLAQERPRIPSQQRSAQAAAAAAHSHEELQLLPLLPQPQNQQSSEKAACLKLSSNVFEANSKAGQRARTFAAC